jgi:hypothetical protein
MQPAFHSMPSGRAGPPAPPAKTFLFRAGPPESILKVESARRTRRGGTAALSAR